jgi:hypothetical protein
VLVWLAAAPALAAVVPRHADAREQPPPFGSDAFSAPPPPPAAAPPPPPRIKSYFGRDFTLRYPPAEFALTADEFEPTDPDAPRGPKKVRPLKAELHAAAGAARVTVVQLQASKLKQTLTQATDVAALGGPEEVARLVLPAGTRVAAARAVAYPQPPVQTGSSLLGTIARPDKVVYRYAVVLPDAQRAEVAIAVSLGQIFLLGASAPAGEWAAAGPALTEVADSFRLVK